MMNPMDEMGDGYIFVFDIVSTFTIWMNQVMHEPCLQLGL